MRQDKVRRQQSDLATILVPGSTLLILVLGLAAQSATYLNHDVAWVLYSSDRIFDGAVVGRDIVAANPPLIWWLSLIPGGLARLLGLPAIGAFRVFVFAISFTSLLACDRIMVINRISVARRGVFLTIAAFLLTISVQRDFGQREHLAVALVLPYVLATGLRMDGGALPARSAAILGAAAALGIAFKPHFLLVPLLLEAALAWRQRTVRTILRPEVFGAVTCFALYAVGLLLFARPWLSNALPAIAKVYWAFDQSESPALAVIGPPLGLMLMGLGAALRFSRSSEVICLALAGAGFLAAAVLQSKFYSYHLFPAFAFLTLAVVTTIADLPRTWGVALGTLTALALGLNAYSAAMGLNDRSDRGRTGSEIKAMATFVDREVPSGGSFLAMATHPYPGFPTALYAHRQWASASNSDLFLPAVVRLREGDAPTKRPSLQFAEQQAHAAMLRDLSRRPDLVLIDERPVRHAIGASKFDFLGFYMEDLRFRRLWAAYERLPSAPPGFAAYMRKPER